MAPRKVILLACGSFNPPTNMHLRMFEVARDYLHRMGTHQVIGGLISPVHDAYGKKDLEASTHRLKMIRIALQTSDWIKVSDWECRQETWTRTRQVLQHYQNHINALLHPSKHDESDGVNEFDSAPWIPDAVRNCDESVQIKLLCGGDLLESFGKPGLWLDDDIESIMGEHGLVVVTRSNTNPLEFIYNSDMLTKYMSNILIVTEWIQNDISSTKIRRALRRSESVKYLVADNVIDYIHKYNLYGAQHVKYLTPPITGYNSNFISPSPTDVSMDSPSSNNCMIICNNTIFSANKNSVNYNKRLAIDTVDNVAKVNTLNAALRHPGQAVKIITETNSSLIKKDTDSKGPAKEASLARPACLQHLSKKTKLSSNL